VDSNNLTFWGYSKINGRTFGAWLRAAGRHDGNVTAVGYMDLQAAWRRGEKPADHTY